MSNTHDPTPTAQAAGSACRFKIVATTDTAVRTFQGTAAANAGQVGTLDQLLIGVICSIVREEKLALRGITIEASMSMESPNAAGERQPPVDAR